MSLNPKPDAIELGALSEGNAATVGERIERDLHQLEHRLVVLLDDPAALLRSLEQLEAGRRNGR